MDYIEQKQQEAYKQRIGKVYGIWKVIDVQYVEGSYNKQEWTIECIKCGRIKKIKYGKELVKGRVGNWCECMKKSNIKKPKPTYEEKMKTHIGEIYGNWKVLDYEAHKGLLVECLNCGRQTYHPATKVFENRIKCTCDSVAKYDESYIGKRYGHLVVRSIVHKELGGRNRLLFDCVCDCGNSRLARPIYLENGDILCCGNDCKYKNENTAIYDGESKTRLYNKYRNMINRCYSHSSKSYSSYGGRGIKVCDEWLNDFFAYKKWALENGWREDCAKDEMTIDRINPDGDYEPSNCRLISLQENQKRY